MLESKIVEVLDLITQRLDVQLSVTSALAEGADRMGARAAVARGLPLECPLPFSRDEYEKDFEREESRAEFRRLLDIAESVWELSGTRADESGAYAAVGGAVVAHSDLLVAIWDGERARGRGGTAEVVEAAIERMPVVWIHPDPAASMRFITSVDGGRPRWVEDAAMEREIRRLFEAAEGGSAT
jgi:hypothetical protein